MGKNLSEEHKKRIGSSVSKWRRENRGLISGRALSEEGRRHLSESLKGKRKSGRHRRNLSISMKKTYQNPASIDRLKLRPKRFGKNNPAYKGGKVLDKNGYIRIRGSKAGRIYEHRLVMENFLGRKLQRWEEVHHINGIKTDNRIENLFLLDKKSHSRRHFVLFFEVEKLRREREVLLDQLFRYKEIYGELK